MSEKIDTLLDLAKKYAEHPDATTFGALAQEIQAIKDAGNGCAQLLAVSRVFHEFLTLAELAERQHRIRRWRAYRRGESGLFFKQTCKDAFRLLLEKGYTGEAIRNALLNQHVELVLTAHPTQASRRTLLDKYFKIAELIELRDKTIMTPEERLAFQSNLRRQILSAWRSNTG
jgi:phosphoenolpyruvate carboxylase